MMTAHLTASHPLIIRSLLLALVMLVGASNVTGQATSDVELRRLVDALSIQLELTQRFNAPEYRRRSRMMSGVIAAWNASSKTAEDRAEFEAWLRESIRASMPGVARRMPAAPRFGPTRPVEPAGPSRPDSSPKLIPPSLPFNDERQLGERVATVESTPPTPATVEQDQGSLIDPVVAARLWAESPASAPLDLDALAKEASQYTPATEFEALASEVITDQASGETKPEKVVEQEQKSPTPKVERPRQRTRSLEAILMVDDDTPKLELLPLSASMDGVDEDRLPLVELSVERIESIARKSPALLLSNPATMSAEPSELLASSNVASPRLAERDGGERVTVRRPVADPREAPAVAAQDDAPSVDLSDEIASKVRRYNGQLRRVEEALGDESPTAFQLASWARQLERLGQDRRLVGIYMEGLNESDKRQLPGFAQADRALRLLERRVASRKALLSDLPAQAVRSELEALDAIERDLVAMREDHH